MQHSLRPAPWLAVALLILVATEANAGAGSTDPSFGDQGVVITPIGPASHARDVVRQADGKLVVVGLTFDGFDGVADFVTRDFALARYHPDGTLDASFGTGGIVTTDFGGLEDVAIAAAIQPDGKILAAGWGWRFGASSNPFDIAIARYHADGTLDASFGLGGLLVTPMGDAQSAARDVVVQDDGKIVVAGRSWADGRMLTVVRYLANGTPDATFGTNGIFTMRPPGSVHAQAHGLAVQADGSILVGADTRFGGASKLTLLKLSTDGTLDTSFGTGGIAFGHEMSSVNNRGNGLVLQPDGKILVAGESQHAVTRFNPDGTLDTTFGTLGRAAIGEGPVHFGTRLEADGKIMTVGYSRRDHVSNTLPRAYSFAFGRYLPDGTPDPSFGSNGLAVPVVQTKFVDSNLMKAFGWSTVADGSDGLIAIGAAQHAPMSLSGNVFETPAHFAMIRLDLCDCPPCFVCDGAGGCVPGPRAGCRRPTTAKKSSLKLKLRRGEARMAWNLKKGEAANLVHLQDPLTTDEHTLCIFGGDPATLLLEATAPAGGFCPVESEKPCWTALGGNPTSSKGFKYKNRDQTPDGLKAIKLKPGAHGKASVKVQGSGEHLPIPLLPAPLPVVVQLQADHGRCWEAEFSSAGLTRNTAEQFKGKSD